MRGRRNECQIEIYGIIKIFSGYIDIGEIGPFVAIKIRTVWLISFYNNRRRVFEKTKEKLNGSHDIECAVFSPPWRPALTKRTTTHQLQAYYLASIVPAASRFTVAII